MPTVSWLDNAIGDWNDPAEWSDSAVPSSTDTVMLTGAGTYTATLYGDGSADELVVDAPAAVLYVLGTLAVTSDILLEAGELDLADGTLQGGTISASGGELQASQGTLNGVSIDGNLSLNQTAAQVYIQSGLTLLGNGGTNLGTLNVSGVGSQIDFVGSQTFANGVLSIGAANGPATLETSDPAGATSAATLTMAPNSVLVVSNGTCDVDLAVGVNGISLSDELDTQANVVVQNNGTLNYLGSGLFYNTGGIYVSAGSTFNIEGDNFQSTGVLSIGSSTLEFSGTFTGTLLSDLGPTTFANATILISGTDKNFGDTLTVGPGSVFPSLSLTGTIEGGTIEDPNGLLSVGDAGTAMLSGVSYSGTLNLAAQNSNLQVCNGLSLLNGYMDLTGNSSVLAFVDSASQTLAAGTVLLGAGQTDGIKLCVTGGTLTLAPALTIKQVGACAAIISASSSPSGTFINMGTIDASSPGGVLTLGGSEFLNDGTIAVSNGDYLVIDSSGFSNSGVLVASNATVSIGSSLTTAQLGHLQLTNAKIGLAGDINNSSGTITIGEGSALGQLSLSGTIYGGKIYDDGFGLEAVAGATLESVSYLGTLDLARPYEQLAIGGGFNLSSISGGSAGTMLLESGAVLLEATTSETFSAMNVFIGSNSETLLGMSIAPPELVPAAGTTLTIGSSTTIRTAGTYSTLGSAASGYWNDEIVNSGMILSASAGCTMTLGSSLFLNDRSILINTGSAVLISDVYFVNASVIAVTPGSELLFSPIEYYLDPESSGYQFTNTGTIRMLGGVIAELTGDGAVPALALLNQSGGLIQGLGTVLCPLLNNGTIESKYASVLSLDKDVSGDGTLSIDQACRLNLLGGVAASEKVTFTSTSGTLGLGLPLSFGAEVDGFGGSNIIDLIGTQVSGVSIENGTLVAATTSGTFFLSTPSALQGAISAGGDGHGGTDLALTVQGSDGPAAVIQVSQQHMVFWASPDGDEFQGDTWNQHGTVIGDWGSLDSLDFTDMNLSSATETYTQASGTGTLTVSDGTHTAEITLVGTFKANYFEVASDGHSGVLLTYR